MVAVRLRIAHFIKCQPSLPQLSNADVERLFLHITLIKTKQPNRLKTSTLDSLLMMTRSGLPTDCVHSKPDSDMCASRLSLQQCSESEVSES